MKKLFTILFLFAFVSKSQAQFVKIVNMRPCYVDVALKGQCPGGTCNGVSFLYHIPPGRSTSIPTFAAASSAPFYVSGGSCGTPAGFVWHEAEIQSVECMPCSGYGVVVGDGTCRPFANAGPNCYNGGPDCLGLIYCATWETVEGVVTITAY